MTSSQNLEEVLTTNPNYIGLIHYPPSPRHVSEEAMEELFKVIKPGLNVVLVTVNEEPETLQKLLSKFPFTHVQLHGQESPDMVSILKGYCKVIKAIPVKSRNDLEQANDYQHADALLFDTKGPKAGGNGYAFDWSILNEYHGLTPFFLSGGIKPEDIEKIQQFHHPHCMGVDLNSGFETAPGMKNKDNINQFIKNFKNELSTSR
ncbi:MAG: phosphoribosylanthranilate isomerase [Bacteroidota bacterium]